MRRGDSSLVERLARKPDMAPELRAALRAVPRAQFLGEMASHSESDVALPIGYGQTTSQPTVIVEMLSLLLGTKRKRDKVLEVGSGCGYQTALLAEIYREVYALERVSALARLTRENLRRAGYNNARVKHSDGMEGLGEVGELDGIIVSAAATQVPEPLLGQLGTGARLVLPLEVDAGVTKITVIGKGDDDALARSEHACVAFVPLLRGVRQ